MLRASAIPLKTFLQNEPLTDAEVDRLGNFLKSWESRKAMNVEELDGFFAALIAGPETVMPSECNAEVFGGDWDGEAVIHAETTITFPTTANAAAK